MAVIVTVLVLSVAFQLSAAFLAYRLIRVTGRRTGWSLIAVAVFLMALRRLESLGMILGGTLIPHGELPFEVVGLTLSIFMFVGIRKISPIFQELADSREELRLRALEQKQLLDYSNDFIYRHDLAGNITFASPAVERITGFTPDEWRTHYTRYYTENEANRVGREVTEAIVGSGQPAPTYRVEVRHKDGGSRWLEVSKQAYSVDGRVAGIIGVARDVTKRVELEREREQLIGDLRAALDNIRTLKEMLPICSSCKKIRDDQGYWNQIESYIREQTGTEFTHSICPECYRRLYPEIYAKITREKSERAQE